MGFCLFSTVAIAARHAQRRGCRRVMIFDFDVRRLSWPLFCFQPLNRLTCCCVAPSSADEAAVNAMTGCSPVKCVHCVTWMQVHHGNGTHDVFYDDPDILFISTHQVCPYDVCSRC